MKLYSLTCQGCGAPLEAPAKAPRLTCQFCGTRLKVQQSGGVLSTEVLGDISESAGRIRENTEYLKLQNELERIDREWDAEKERFMVRGRHGQLSVPSKAGSLAAGAFIVLFGLVWTLIAGGIAGGAMAGFGRLGAIAGVFPCFGLLFIGFGVFIAIHNYSKAGDFELRRQQYQRRRRQLLDEMQTP